jgi:hypothetical protein
LSKGLILKTSNHYFPSQADFDRFVGVQSEALFGRAKLRFELQQTRQNRIDRLTNWNSKSILDSKPVFHFRIGISPQVQSFPISNFTKYHFHHQANQLTELIYQIWNRFAI